MKKSILLVLLASLSTSCIGIKSVVDRDAFSQPYSNPLIVIPFEDYNSKEFSHELKEHMEFHFNAEQKNMAILVFDQTQDTYTLNANQEFDHRIREAISTDGKDLLLIFQPTGIHYAAGGNTYHYLITGIDTQTKKEMWKAKFATMDGPFSNGMYVKQAAKKIYEKLKSDGVL